MDVSPSTEARMAKIQGWLEWGESRYGDLLSRASETAGQAGWDGEPRVRPCECALDNRRGKLCLACDNTGLRSCNRDDERAIDPYALGVKSVKGGFTARSAGDESAAQLAAARVQLLNSAIARLERDRLQRDGEEAAPDKAMQQLIAIAGEDLKREPRSYQKIMVAVRTMADYTPLYARALPSGRHSLWLLSLMVAGSIARPPGE